MKTFLLAVFASICCIFLLSTVIESNTKLEAIELIHETGYILNLIAFILFIITIVRPQIFKKDGFPMGRLRLFGLVFLLMIISPILFTTKFEDLIDSHELKINLFLALTPFFILIFKKNKPKNTNKSELSDAERTELREEAINLFNNGFPSISPRNLFVKQNERAILEVDATLAENITNREFVAGSAGASFRVAKGLTLRTGGTKGHFLSKKEETLVADGYLTITTKRIVFTGDEKAFSIPYSKLLSLKFDDTRFILNVENRQTPYVVYVDKRDAYLIAAAVKYAQLQRDDDITTPSV